MVDVILIVTFLQSFSYYFITFVYQSSGPVNYSWQHCPASTHEEICRSLSYLDMGPLFPMVFFYFSCNE